MADVLKLKDGDVRPVAGVEDVIEIIKEKLGDDIANYLLEKLEEYDELEKEYDKIIASLEVFYEITKDDRYSEDNEYDPEWYWDSAWYWDFN